MKIFYYCQHVLGIGHFHRSLEICTACAEKHEVTMIVGGPPVPVTSEKISFFRLPCLRMDETFNALTPCETHQTLEEVKRQRCRELLNFIRQQRPDCMIIELYPFGRKAFRFELDPLLQELAADKSTSLFCSLRDILVEKKEGLEKFENRVVDTLNRSFDAVLIHADQKIVDLAETFGQVDRIRVPLHYTGFVARAPQTINGTSVRRRLHLSADQKLCVVSIGSGSVGTELLLSAAQAFNLLNSSGKWFMQVFTGPYCDKSTYQTLLHMSSESLAVSQFTDSFPDWLAAADVSLSMAGYNTCMNLLATGVPALLYPFRQNREQAMRVDRLGAYSSFKKLDSADLVPERLAHLIRRASETPRTDTSVSLEGARKTKAIIEHHCCR